MSRARDVSNIDNIPTAKGDIFAATAASTPARIGVGSNDQVLVSDSTTSTGLAWKSYGAQVVAGKNAIINGAMDVWQRGTTFTATGWSADRWYVNADSGVATTITRSTDAPTGFRYSMKFQRTAGNTATGAHGIGQSFETQESIRFAGKTVTYSFWAKRGANYSGSGNLLEWRVGFSTGTDQSITTAYGGWAGYSEANSPAATLTTSWQRFSMTFNVPSNATQISVRVFQAPTGTAGADDSYFVTGFQFEESATVTPFSRAGGGLGGELALCQRYYEKSYNDGVNPAGASDPGVVFGCRPNGGAYLYAPFKVTKRTIPTITVYSPATGTSGKVRNYNSAADETASTGFIGHNGFKTAGTTASNDLLGLQFTADAEL